MKAALERVLGERIADIRAVGGGCISNASRLTTASGACYFLKSGSDAALFHAEAESLAALRGTRTVRVPAVIAVEDWLLTEWLEPGAIGHAGWERLGRELAALHAQRRDTFGWATSNFIGSLPQANEWLHDWPSFWRTQRIAPQARGLSARHRSRIESLLDHADELLETGNEEGASLLHGDLWSGNWCTSICSAARI
jgi:fructosamine-3-kinase